MGQEDKYNEAYKIEIRDKEGIENIFSTIPSNMKYISTNIILLVLLVMVFFSNIIPFSETIEKEIESDHYTNFKIDDNLHYLKDSSTIVIPLTNDEMNKFKNPRKQLIQIMDVKRKTISIYPESLKIIKEDKKFLLLITDQKISINDHYIVTITLKGQSIFDKLISSFKTQ